MSPGKKPSTVTVTNTACSWISCFRRSPRPASKRFPAPSSSDPTMKHCRRKNTEQPLGPATRNPLVDIEISLAARLAEAFNDHAQEFEGEALIEANEIFANAAAEVALDQIEKAIAQARKPRGPMEQIVDKATGYEIDRQFWRLLA